MSTIAIEKVQVFLKRIFFELLFAFLFTLITVIGFLFSTYEDIDVINLSNETITAYVMGSIVIFLVFFFLFYSLKSWLKNMSPRQSKTKFASTLSNKQLWAVSSAIMLIAYLPIVFSIVSVLTPDSWSSIDQINGDAPLNNANPIIYTLFVGIFVQAGTELVSFDFGLLLFSVVQSSLLAMIFSCVIVWMRNLGAGSTTIVITYIFYGILPINAVAGTIVWKDILFAAFGLLLLVVLRRLYLAKDNFFNKRNVSIYLILAFLFCAFRSNGVYAYSLFLALALIINFRFLFNKKYLLLLLTPLVSFIVYSSLINLITSPPRPVTVVVPLQQIARTVKYHGDTINQQDRELIDNILPFDELGEVYNPELTDPVARVFNQDEYDENSLTYQKLWFDFSRNYTKTYIASFIYNTYGYVYPLYKSPSSTDTIMDNSIHINAPEDYEDSAFEEGSKLASAEYRNLVTSLVPVLHNVGLYFCLVLFSVYVAIVKKRKEMTGVYLLMLALFVSTILGPVNGEFRYLYLFVLATPFVLVSVFYGETKKRKVQKRVHKG